MKTRLGWGNGVAGAIAVLLAVSACGTDGPAATSSAGSVGAGTSSAPVDRPVFDPAVKFAAAGAPLPEIVTTDVQDETTKTLDAPAVLLRGGTAWAATSEGLLAFDPASGDIRADLKPEGTSTEIAGGAGANRTDLEPPQVVTVAGQALVVQTFAVTVEGQGTTAPHPAIEVVAADADAVRLAWRQVIDLPAGYEVPDGSVLRTAVAGFDGSTAVVRLAAGHYPGTLAIDLAARKAAWVQPNLDPVTVAAGQVAGLVRGPDSWSEESLQARRVADGSPLWSKKVEAASVVAAGPKLLLLWGLKGTEFGTITGIRIGTGEELAVQLPKKAPALPSHCVPDGQSVVVCANSSVFGLDPDTGKVLWSIADDPDRLAPQLTGAWHGKVYGTTGRNGPVVLDAHTGKDVATAPGAAPYWTDGRYAVTGEYIVAVTG